MRSKLRRPSHATVVAYLALFVALGGTGYAVNEWTGANIVDDSLTSADIKGKPAAGGNPAVNGTLNTNDIADGSLRNVDIAQNQISSNRVLDGTLTGVDVQDNSLTGADVQDNSITSGDVQDNTLTGTDIQEFSLGTVPNASAVDGIGSAGLVKGGGDVIKGRMDVAPGNSQTIDVGLGHVVLECNVSNLYALFYYEQAATLGGMDVFWRNLDGVGYTRFHNLDPPAQLTPFTARADVVTLHTTWTAEWTPAELVFISVRFDADANKCSAIYRGISSIG